MSTGRSLVHWRGVRLFLWGVVLWLHLVPQLDPAAGLVAAYGALGLVSSSPSPARPKPERGRYQAADRRRRDVEMQRFKCESCGATRQSAISVKGGGERHCHTVMLPTDGRGTQV